MQFHVQVPALPILERAGGKQNLPASPLYLGSFATNVRTNKHHFLSCIVKGRQAIDARLRFLEADKLQNLYGGNMDVWSLDGPVPYMV